MKKVDLHLHSYASDGSWSAEELLEEIDRKNVKIFAVTDHDETGCVAEMAELVKDREDLTYIKGFEGTVTYRGIEHHILTYGIDEDNEKLQRILKNNRRVRERYDNALMEWLHPKYPQISVEDYNAYDYNPYQGGWRAFGYLKDRGVITGLGDYFSEVQGFDFEKEFISPEKYLPAMKKLGYKTVLAHPPAYIKGDLYDEEHLDYFLQWGLSGIECYNQYLNDQNNSKYYVDYCRRHNLLITGGSDCHGEFAGRQIGYPDIDEGMVKLS